MKENDGFRIGRDNTALRLNKYERHVEYEQKGGKIGHIRSRRWMTRGMDVMKTENYREKHN